MENNIIDIIFIISNISLIFAFFYSFWDALNAFRLMEFKERWVHFSLSLILIFFALITVILKVDSLIYSVTFGFNVLLFLISMIFDVIGMIKQPTLIVERSQVNYTSFNSARSANSAK